MCQNEYLRSKELTVYYTIAAFSHPKEKTV